MVKGSAFEIHLLSLDSHLIPQCCSCVVGSLDNNDNDGVLHDNNGSREDAKELKKMKLI